MLTVIETPVFQRMVAEVLPNAERTLLIAWIAGNPLVGDVIAGGGGLRKVRWQRQGMGKRGGARVIYFVRNEPGEVVLVAIYAKAKFDNMPLSVLKTWKEAFDA
jgi:mRNA-degrading endonuclease RelE of RelBE toxin-antitoxin system